MRRHWSPRIALLSLPLLITIADRTVLIKHFSLVLTPSYVLQNFDSNDSGRNLKYGPFEIAPINDAAEELG